MSRITVDVPDSVLAEEKQKELTQLRGKTKRLEAKVKKLEATIAEHQAMYQEALRIKTLINDSTLVEHYEDW